MEIYNNYKQRQTNFGSLKSIKYDHCYPDVYPKEMTKLFTTIKESKDFNDFFKKYDVDMFIKEDIDTRDLNMILKTTVPTNNGNNLYPEIKLVAKSKYYTEVYDGKKRTNYEPTSILINDLTKQVKNMEFSNLKSKLDKSLEKLKENENLNNLKKKEKAEFDKIEKNLLTGDSSYEGSTNFVNKLFVKVLSWLLDN